MLLYTKAKINFVFLDHRVQNIKEKVKNFYLLQAKKKKKPKKTNLYVKEFGKFRCLILPAT